MDLSGVGKLQVVAENICNHWTILLISVIRVVSLALDDSFENVRKDIVASIERTTITTISSTRVKAF
jgi:hypothetical protein